MSRQTWTGLDRMGNEVSKSFDDMETWLKPIMRYESRPVNPNDRFSKIERKLAGISLDVKVFDKAFSAKALDELNTLRSPASQLIILKVDEQGEKIGNPYVVGKYEDFRSRPFEELYEYASTPRQPDQTKLGNEETNNKNKQYG